MFINHKKRCPRKARQETQEKMPHQQMVWDREDTNIYRSNIYPTRQTNRHCIPVTRTKQTIKQRLYYIIKLNKYHIKTKL